MVVTMETKSMIMKWLVSLNYRDKPHWTPRQLNRSHETKKCLTFQSGLPFQSDPKNSDATRKKKSFEENFKKNFLLWNLFFASYKNAGSLHNVKHLLFVFSREKKKITSSVVFPLDICMFPKLFVPEGLHAKSNVTVIKQNQNKYFVMEDPRYIVNMLSHKDMSYSSAGVFPSDICLSEN